MTGPESGGPTAQNICDRRCGKGVLLAVRMRTEQGGLFNDKGDIQFNNVLAGLLEGDLGRMLFSALRGNLDQAAATARQGNLGAVFESGAEMANHTTFAMYRCPSRTLPDESWEPSERCRGDVADIAAAMQPFTGTLTAREVAVVNEYGLGPDLLPLPAEGGAGADPQPGPTPAS